jgi:uncharacterized membrane protein (GlpM family)
MLILKLILSPLFVALVALTGRRWGAKLAGLLSGLPIIAGPIVYFLYFDQGVEFAKTAAAATVAGVVPLSSFCFTYAWIARKISWQIAVLASLLVYGVLGILILKLELGLKESFLLSSAVVVVKIRFSPKHLISITKTPASNIEVIIRMIAAACLVLLVTFFANTLGADYSGVLAAFPLASTLIAVFSHKYHSAYHAIDSLKALKFGLLSMPAFFLTLCIMLEQRTFHQAFLLSILVAIIIQGVVWLIRLRSQTV